MTCMQKQYTSEKIWQGNYYCLVYTLHTFNMSLNTVTLKKRIPESQLFSKKMST